MIFRPLIPFTLCLLPAIVRGQSIQQTEKFLYQTERSLGKMDKKVSIQTLKFEKRCRRVEEKIKRKLRSQETTLYFDESCAKIKNKLKAKLYSKVPLSGFLDTTQVTLQYFKKIGVANPTLEKAILNQEAFQGKLEALDEYNKWRVDRNLKFESLLAIHPDLKKYTRQLKQYTFYGRQQLADLTATFEDRERLKQKILPELMKLKFFNDFFNQYKYFFNLGLNYNESRNIEGLQSQAELSLLAAERVGTDPGSQGILQDRINAARSEIDNYRSKLDNLETINETPDFKINNLKTKRFLRRFEPGWNFQFQRSNYYFPATADIAGQIAYKFHKDGTFGMGLSYKAGMGDNWTKIKISHRGFGIRSFVDWKIKGSFYIHGGYEKNKNIIETPASAYYRKWNGWNTAALLGVNRIQKVGPKLKMNTMILFNFLADQQPKTDRVIVRFGHTL